MSSSNPARHIKALVRRADHLARRIAESRARGKESTYDSVELSALTWAIGQLTDRGSGILSAGRRVTDHP